MFFFLIINFYFIWWATLLKNSSSYEPHGTYVSGFTFLLHQGGPPKKSFFSLSSRGWNSLPGACSDLDVCVMEIKSSSQRLASSALWNPFLASYVISKNWFEPIFDNFEVALLEKIRKSKLNFDSERAICKWLKKVLHRNLKANIFEKYFWFAKWVFLKLWYLVLDPYCYIPLWEISLSSLTQCI